MRVNGRGGFSLTELLVAVLLSGMFFVASVVVYSAGLNSQISISSLSIIDDANSVIGRTIRRSAGAASHVQIPAPGSLPTNDFLLWFNANSATGARLNPAQPIEFQYFCVLSEYGENRMVMHENRNYVGPWPMPVFACDNPGPANTSRMTLAGGVSGMSVVPLFDRISGNAVAVSYSIDIPARGPRSAKSLQQSFRVSIDSAL